MPPTIFNSLTWDWTGGTVDLQTPDTYFDIYQGFNEYPEVRGQDDVVPGLPGRMRRNRVDDVAVLELRGWVRGIGGTVVERQQAFRASVAALRASLDPTGEEGTLTVLAPYLGLASGSQSIQAYAVSILGGDHQNTMSFMRFSIELEAIGDPPRWTEGS